MILYFVVSDSASCFSSLHELPKRWIVHLCRILQSLSRTKSMFFLSKGCFLLLLMLPPSAASIWIWIDAQRDWLWGKRKDSDQPVLSYTFGLISARGADVSAQEGPRPGGPQRSHPPKPARAERWRTGRSPCQLLVPSSKARSP